jgi:protein-disulfide isomerase
MAHLSVPVTEKDHTQGSSQAPIVLVQYGDYQCPSCGMAHLVVKQLQKSLKGNLRFVFRNFPLVEVHPYALAAAEIAEASGLQNKFWEMHDYIFEHQRLLSLEALPRFAEQLQLNMQKINSGVHSLLVKNKIEEDFRSGIRSDVNGTPTFYINGERYDGETSHDGMMQALLQRNLSVSNSNL